MDKRYIPIIQGRIVISKTKTTFNTVSSEVVVDVPASVISKIVGLCNGSNYLDDVIDLLSTEWDRDSIRGLVGELIYQQVIIDGKKLEKEFWNSITNPSRFPSNVSDKEVAELVEQAVKRHRSEVAGKTYQSVHGELSRLIKNRKSVRTFSGENVDFQTVVDLLWSAYGECLTEDGCLHRSVPSAGALYPLMIHVGLFTNTGELGYWGRVQFNHI